MNTQNKVEKKTEVSILVILSALLILIFLFPLAAPLVSIILIVWGGAVRLSPSKVNMHNIAAIAIVSGVILGLLCIVWYYGTFAFYLKE